MLKFDDIVVVVKDEYTNLTINDVIDLTQDEGIIIKKEFQFKLKCYCCNGAVLEIHFRGHNAIIVHSIIQ